jgi:hypothetical protein
VPQSDERSAYPRRAPEAIALFNEVFTSELLVNACWAKEQDSGTGLTWPAAFLILPLALHPPTRENLPRSPSVTLAAWAVGHTALAQTMTGRVATMVEPTKRAIRHGLRADRLKLSGTDLLAAQRPRNPTSDWPQELTAAVRAARLSGRWFRATDAYTAFSLLGIGT